MQRNFLYDHYAIHHKAWYVPIILFNTLKNLILVINQISNSLQKLTVEQQKKPKLINGISNFEIANFIIKTHFCLNLSNSKPSINLDVHRHNFFWYWLAIFYLMLTVSLFRFCRNSIINYFKIAGNENTLIFSGFIWSLL